MTSSYDTLADNYDYGRLGYADDVYDLLLNSGLKPDARVLDVGCGTGLASGPLIDNNFPVTGVDPSQAMLDRARAHYPRATWQLGRAEDLPFEPASFDAAISAQVFHHVDRVKAFEEIARVLKPGGLAAIWWKHLMSDDPVKVARDEAARELGFEPPVSGLKGGFTEFYGSTLQNPIVRVIPWRAGTMLSKYVRYERSRENVREMMGGRAEAYFDLLERKLRARFGAGDPYLTLSYTHYVYLAKK